LHFEASQDDLLKLDAITDCQREIIREFLLESHTVSLDVSRRQCRHLSSRIIGSRAGSFLL
jgi:hypothetical protein